MDTYTQNGEGRRFKQFRRRPRGNRQTKTSSLTRPRFPSCDYIPITASPIPPREGLQNQTVHSDSVRSLAQKQRRPLLQQDLHQCRATRSLSKRQGSEPRAPSFLAVVAHTQNAGAIPCAVGATSPASRHFGAKPSGPRGVLGWTP
jgi:hypothetical protein